MICLACGITSSPPSREHIFSKWLLEEFKGHSLLIGLYKGLGDDARPARKMISVSSMVLKSICAVCNNGWMSRLEERAKPLILGLISDSFTLSSLPEEDRRALAKWAGKTAIVESHAVGAECPVERKFLDYIRTNEEPGRIGVVACQTNMKSFGHMQVGVVTDLIGGGKVAGNIIVIALPGLAFVTVFPMIETRYELKCVLSLYQPLWPAPKSWRPMKKDPMAPHLDDADTLAALAERIELRQLLT